MKSRLYALSFLLMAAPLASHADQVIPAGSLIQCTVSEPKLSSKTTAIGDPVLCQVSHVERYGRSTLPTSSYLVGRFEDYKDPGHFVGKGWMELKFDRMVIEPDQVIPISARVISAPGYPVDRDGRIHGKGHPVRDTIEWMIPVLWPIDLINLPRRGPRPVLKDESRLTLKIMDDLVVPTVQEAPHDDYGFAHRAPTTYEPPPPPPPAPAQPIVYQYAPPPPPIVIAPPVVLVTRSGYGLFARTYFVEGNGRIRYTAMNGAPYYIWPRQLNLASTYEANRRRGVSFNMPGYGY